jgi:hypothetical protein
MARPTLLDANLHTVHLRGESAGHDSASLAFLEMNVEGWTVLVRWERALQFQAHLAVQRHTTQLQTLARMTVDQCWLIRQRRKSRAFRHYFTLISKTRSPLLRDPLLRSNHLRPSIAKPQQVSILAHHWSSCEPLEQFASEVARGCARRVHAMQGKNPLRFFETGNRGFRLCE